MVECSAGEVLARDFLKLEALKQQLEAKQWQSLEEIQSRHQMQSQRRTASVSVLDRQLRREAKQREHTQERNLVIRQQASLLGAGGTTSHEAVSRIRDSRERFAMEVERMSSHWNHQIAEQLRREIDMAKQDTLHCQARQNETLEAAIAQEALLAELQVEKRRAQEERTKMYQEVQEKQLRLRQRLLEERAAADQRVEVLNGKMQPQMTPGSTDGMQRVGDGCAPSAASFSLAPEPCGQPAQVPVASRAAQPPVNTRGCYVPAEGTRQFEVYRQLRCNEMEMQADLRLLEDRRVLRCLRCGSVGPVPGPINGLCECCGYALDVTTVPPLTALGSVLRPDPIPHQWGTALPAKAFNMSTRPPVVVQGPVLPAATELRRPDEPQPFAGAVATARRSSLADTVAMAESTGLQTKPREVITQAPASLEQTTLEQERAAQFMQLMQASRDTVASGKPLVWPGRPEDLPEAANFEQPPMQPHTDMASFQTLDTSTTPKVSKGETPSFSSDILGSLGVLDTPLGPAFSLDGPSLARTQLPSTAEMPSKLDPLSPQLLLDSPRHNGPSQPHIALQPLKTQAHGDQQPTASNPCLRSGGMSDWYASSNSSSSPTQKPGPSPAPHPLSGLKTPPDSVDLSFAGSVPPSPHAEGGEMDCSGERPKTGEDEKIPLSEVSRQVDANKHPGVPVSGPVEQRLSPRTATVKPPSKEPGVPVPGPEEQRLSPREAAKPSASKEPVVPVPMPDEKHLSPRKEGVHIGLGGAAGTPSSAFPCPDLRSVGIPENLAKSSLMSPGELLLDSSLKDSEKEKLDSSGEVDLDAMIPLSARDKQKQLSPSAAEQLAEAPKPGMLPPSETLPKDIVSQPQAPSPASTVASAAAKGTAASSSVAVGVPISSGTAKKQASTDERAMEGSSDALAMSTSANSFFTFADAGSPSLGRNSSQSCSSPLASRQAAAAAAASPRKAVEEPPAATSPRQTIEEPPAAASPRTPVEEPPAAASPRKAIEEPPAAASPKKAIEEPPAESTAEATARERRKKAEAAELAEILGMAEEENSPAGVSPPPAAEEAPPALSLRPDPALQAERAKAAELAEIMGSDDSDEDLPLFLQQRSRSPAAPKAAPKAAAGSTALDKTPPPSAQSPAPATPPPLDTVPAGAPVGLRLGATSANKQVLSDLGLDESGDSDDQLKESQGPASSEGGSSGASPAKAFPKRSNPLSRGRGRGSGSILAGASSDPFIGPGGGGPGLSALGEGGGLAKAMALSRGGGGRSSLAGLRPKAKAAGSRPSSGSLSSLLQIDWSQAEDFK
eukprot:TRINITY_DN4586_c0_g1_i1.p1 TRINITY_DN4586_c0_g1~~TRINITY_DN4586_c0_g1_i1.p1  ORF type:complete len:1295 (+),score=297.56 TRINITY_DN4586_c0_g1_i1:132-4016(+)